MEKLSCIILNYNTSEMTHKVVVGFSAAAEKLPHEIIVIDNGSTEILAEFSNEGVTVIKNQHNLGFAAGVNQGLKLATGDYILLLNSDVFIDEANLTALINYLENSSEVGIVGPMMKFPNDDFQASAGFIPTLWGEFLRFSTLGKYFSGGTLLYKNTFTDKQFMHPIKVDWVSGGCLLVKRKIIDSIGFLDELYFFGIEDFDFCLRCQKNSYKVIYLPTTFVIHHHGYSSGGHASVFSLKQEKKGMNYFLSKHYKKKKFLHFFVMSLYSLKIFFLGIILGRK